MGETLKFAYANWASHAKENKVPENPRDWQESHVKTWLEWTMEEFTFGGFEVTELVDEFKVRLPHDHPMLMSRIY